MGVIRSFWPLLAVAAGGPVTAGGLGTDLPECDFERLDGGSVTAEAIARLRRPTILTGLTAQWPARSKWSTASAFAKLYGDAEGYARDHDQLELRDVDVTVQGYLEGSTGASSGPGLGSSAAFFVNDYEDARLLDRLQGDYASPPPLRNWEALRVFSLERPWAGVAFHRHEASWQALLAGRKAWFLSDPSVEAVPQTSPCSFLGDGAPPLAERCELHAGEILFVPKGWWHATCTLPEEPTLAIGGVGSTQSWPPAVLEARFGRVISLDGDTGMDMEIPAGGGDIFQGGERPLFMAAAFGHMSAVETLLAQRADPNAKRRDGRTPLHEAARRGDLMVVEKLRNAGADIAAVDASGSTPLHHACAERGSTSVVAFLLSQGARAAVRRGDGRTALHVACRGHVNPVALLRVLVQQGHAPPSLRDSHGMTPLMHCAAAGHAQGVGLLLRFGGLDAAAAQDDEGQDALSHALMGRGDVGVVERLLAAGLRAKGGLGDIALHGEASLLPVLAAAGATVEGAVIEAARAGHADVIQVLLSQLNASAEERDVDGATPLHVAALGGHISAVKALLSAKANASEVDALGMTPLHYAATTGGRIPLRRQQEVLKALASAGGPQLWQQGASEGQGLEPLHLAAANGDVGLARWLVLEEEVADPRAQDASGFTPADAAEQANHTALASLLRDWAQRSEL